MTVSALARGISAVALAATAATPAATVAFHFRDPRIDEASGIAVAERTPGIVFVQNDSGDTNRFFAVNAHTGETVAVVQVRGARNVDWEDLAAAPDPAGTPSIWLADTGDNDARRSEVQVYRVPEPRVRADEHDAVVRTPPAAVWRLRYPGGPVNTESLAVTPAGIGYLVTKSIAGLSTVYRLPQLPDANRIRPLRKVGAIRFVPHGVGNPFGIAGELTATGAAISRNGTLLAVRTYASAFLWRLGSGGVPAALHATPTRIDLPRQRQGEGITFAGRDLLVDSEGSRTPVDRVPLPAPLARLAAARKSADPSSTTALSGGSGTASQPGSGPASPTSSVPPHHKIDYVGVVNAVIIAVLIVGATLWIALRRRRAAGEGRGRRR